MALRKNQLWLTAWEKKQFTDAVLKLKAEKKGDTNTYDQYVTMHWENRTAGHEGPAFFAWHREFLRRFEGELQRIMNDSTIGLPYWDWSVHQSAPSWPFTPDFLGGNGTGSWWQVTDGPFAGESKWPLDRINGENYPFLRRQFGDYPILPPVKSLPTPADVSRALGATPYDVWPWDPRSQSGFRNMAEGWIPGPGPQGPQMHNRVHVYVGGSMVPMTSPNDPVFWLHHCYIDKLWADWQAMHPNEEPYLPSSGARPGHNLTDRMPPWNEKTPEDVLTHWTLGYHYDTDDYLMAFDVLYPGQSIASASRIWSLELTYDNNLTLRSNNNAWPRWVTTDHQQPDGWCVMQDDGNLVIYDWSDPYKVIWPSNTDGNPGAYLWVPDDGHVGIYKSDNSPTNFYRPPPPTG